MQDRKFAQIHAVPNRDLISGLYRKIGISAVAAALEAKAYEPQKPSASPKDIPAFLRDEIAV
jgi:hypothetical protein